MNCPHANELAAYADGELRDSEGSAISDHIVECETCQQVVLEDQRLAAAFGQLVCPDGETLALFVDDALPADTLERTATHVVACDPCQDVVSWTREAQQATLKRSGKRRRIAARARTTTPFPAAGLVAGIAAAAALLLVVILMRKPRATAPVGPRSAKLDKTKQAPRGPRVSDVVTKTKTKTQAKTGDTPTPTQTGDTPTPTQTDTPTPTPTKTGDTPTPTPTKTGDTPTPTQTDTPTPAPTSTTAPVAPKRATVAVAALSVGDLQWRDPKATAPAWKNLDGAATLPAGSQLLARRPGSFALGEASCFLQGTAIVAIAAPDRLSLERGAVVLDGSPATSIACGAATVQPEKGGARLYLETQGGGGYLLTVVAGSARVDLAGQRSSVGVGEARLIRKNDVRPVKAKAVLARASAAAEIAIRRSGIDVPRGVLAGRVLRQAAQRLESKTLAQRAQAALIVQAVLLDPRLAHQARPLQARADAALSALALEPDLGAALGATTLAIVDQVRGGARLTKALRATLTRLAENLAARPVASLAIDGEALLALRAVERLTRWKAPKKLWAQLGTALRTTSDPAALARSLIVKRRALSSSALGELDTLLAQDPIKKPLDARTLLAVTQALILSQAWSAERERRLLAHAAGGQDNLPERAFVAVRHTIRALGGKVPEAPPSFAIIHPVAADRREDRRVTLIYRPGKRRPRTVFLVGSWDDWREEATPMRRRADGAWTATIVVPAGRHEYKLRLDGGKTWEVDPANPLSTTDPDGNVNSVLVLD